MTKAPALADHTIKHLPIPKYTGRQSCSNEWLDRRIAGA
jgi:hypothetical protein